MPLDGIAVLVLVILTVLVTWKAAGIHYGNETDEEMIRRIIEIRLKKHMTPGVETEITASVERILKTMQAT